MQLTKFEVARRQLVTAIRLFFEDADSVSVYTLAHAAWEVLNGLCRHRGIETFHAQASIANDVPIAEIRRAANYGRNFFKHAQDDPDDVLDDFSDERNDSVLLAATLDYGSLAESKPMEIQVFQIWHFAVNPQNTAGLPDYDPIREGAEIAFPGIAGRDRRTQKATGRRILLEALRDPELMKDPRTDRTATRALT